jgi:chromate transport protein ChrA
LTGQYAIDDLTKKELKVTWIAQLAATFYFTFPLVGIYESYQLHHELYGLLRGVTGKIAVIDLYMNILINPMHGSLKFNDTITVSVSFFFFLFFFFGPSLYLMTLDDIINFEVIFNYYKKA